MVCWKPRGRSGWNESMKYSESKIALDFMTRPGWLRPLFRTQGVTVAGIWTDGQMKFTGVVSWMSTKPREHNYGVKEDEI